MSVTVNVTEIKDLMYKALALRGITGGDAAFIIADYVESELEGHPTHGLSKFLMIDAGLSLREGVPELVKDAACFAQINGHRELGHLAALKATRLCMEKAEKNGIGMVAITNVSRYSRITPYTRMMADGGYIGIVTNNGGPSCVAPFGGRRAIFGTNPLSFGFPGAVKPYVFDFATSEKVWGAIRASIIEGTPLPANSFLDQDGNYTTDPNQAETGIPFGGPKGYALCYALEVMTGAFMGAKMGLDAQDEFDLGYLFTALSPAMFGDLSSFQESMDKMAQDVRDSPPKPGSNQVFVPGEIFGTTLASKRASQETTMPDDIYQRLRKMSVSLDGGYENNRMMN